MGIFSKKPATQPSPAPQNVTRRDIRYDPNLVATFEETHKELRALYARIGELLNQQHYTGLADALINLKTCLQSHIMVENVRFYTYLEQHLEGDSENAAVMHDFRHEMNGIAHKVVQFTKKYSSSGVTALTREQFEKEYQEIGTMLQQRLHSEETDLYPLYQSMR